MRLEQSWDVVGTAKERPLTRSKRLLPACQCLPVPDVCSIMLVLLRVQISKIIHGAQFEQVVISHI